MKTTVYVLCFTYAYEDTIPLRIYHDSDFAERISARLQRRMETLKDRTTQDYYSVRESSIK